MNETYSGKGPFFLPGGENGCLVIHGFTGRPCDMHYLGTKLNAAGFTVNGIQLNGHDTTPEDMNTTTWRDWAESVEEGYQELKGKCKKIFVAGLSMGGLYTLYLAERYSIDGIACLAAALRFADWRVHFAGVLKRFLPYITSAEAKALKEKDDGIYDRTPVACVESLVRLRNMVEKDLHKVQCPTIIIQSPKDDMVRPMAAQVIHDKIASKERKLIWLKDSKHMVTTDVEKDQVADEVTKFFLQYAGKA